MQLNIKIDILEELRCSIHGNGAFWDNGRVRGEAELATDAEVRIIRPNIARWVLEFYHSMLCTQF